MTQSSLKVKVSKVIERPARIKYNPTFEITNNWETINVKSQTPEMGKVNKFHVITLTVTNLGEIYMRMNKD